MDNCYVYNETTLPHHQNPSSASYAVFPAPPAPPFQSFYNVPPTLPAPTVPMTPSPMIASESQFGIVEEKNSLQVLNLTALHAKCQQPEFEVVRVGGKDNLPIYQTTVYWNNRQWTETALANSKVDSKRKCALRMIHRLSANGITPFSAKPGSSKSANTTPSRTPIHERGSFQPMQSGSKYPAITHQTANHRHSPDLNQLPRELGNKYGNTAYGRIPATPNEYHPSEPRQSANSLSLSPYTQSSQATYTRSTTQHQSRNPASPPVEKPTRSNNKSFLSSGLILDPQDECVEVRSQNISNPFANPSDSNQDLIKGGEQCGNQNGIESNRNPGGKNQDIDNEHSSTMRVPLKSSKKPSGTPSNAEVGKTRNGDAPKLKSCNTVIMNRINDSGLQIVEKSISLAGNTGTVGMIEAVADSVDHQKVKKNIPSSPQNISEVATVKRPRVWIFCDAGEKSVCELTRELTSGMSSKVELSVSFFGDEETQEESFKCTRCALHSTIAAAASVQAFRLQMFRIHTNFLQREMYNLALDCDIDLDLSRVLIVSNLPDLVAHFGVELEGVELIEAENLREYIEILTTSDHSDSE